MEAPLRAVPGSPVDPGITPTSNRHSAAEDARHPHIVFDMVTVRYGKLAALRDFALTLDAGEAVALLGPSGSGKTTILRALAGFTPIYRGRIAIKGVDISTLSPQRRHFGIVVQNYALFPHMSVADNVAFGLRARRVSRSEVGSIVTECLALVGMEGYTNRRPHELSGGQQQRVALARALAIRPDVLLMDEPLSALDAPLRREMLAELIRLHRKLPDLTMILVTHDQSEALALADRVGLLKDGTLLALDTPKHLYDRPPNRFAAEFLGQANLLEVEVTGENANGFAQARLGQQTLLVRSGAEEPSSARRCWLCLRPHQVALRPDGSDGAHMNVLQSTVLASEWKGAHYHVTVDLEGQFLNLEANAAQSPPVVGSSASLYFSPAAAWLLPKET